MYKESSDSLQLRFEEYEEYSYILKLKKQKNGNDREKLFFAKVGLL